MSHIVVGLDIGTAKIACLIGEVDRNNRIHVVGVGIAPSQGVKKGVIVDMAAASVAVEEAVHKAERAAGVEVQSAFVGVAGAHISGINSRGTVSIARSNHRVDAQDVRRALESARAVAIPHSQEVVHIIPRGYWLDGENGVRNPIGLHGYRLEVEAHIVTAAVTALQTLEQCCRTAGVLVEAFVLEPLASGEAVLEEDEKELGVVLVDIGGGTTDISIFLEGSVWHTASLPLGGAHLTHDLAVALQCPVATAERLKLRYGAARPEAIVEDELIEVSAFGDTAVQQVWRSEIAEILAYRVADIFDLIQREIKRSGYDGLLPAGLVFCGGTASLPGLREAAHDAFGLPVRIAPPHTERLSGLVDRLGSPAYATSVGLLEWGAHHHQVKAPAPEHPEVHSAWERFREWLHMLLPG